MAESIRVALAQWDFLVGDIPGNADKVIELAQRARQEHQADLVVFPELALTGYPPEDLLLRPSLQVRVEKALQAICQAVTDVALIVGLPWRDGDVLYNAAALIEQGQVKGLYYKQSLPNYQVFDEWRYFRPGQLPFVVPVKGIQLGINICEDLWQEAPMRLAAEAGAQLLVSINASPFHVGKQRERYDLVRQRVRDNKLPVIYLNTTGGQDELVFDGGSFVMDASGELTMAAPQFQQDLFLVECRLEASRVIPLRGHCHEPLSEEASVYQALVMGVRDYVNKNRFKSVVLGLSGGLDSAVTLAVAVDALGPDRVRAIMMPFRYTSSMSLEDAEQQANTLGVRYEVLTIEPIYDAFMKVLAEPFAGLPVDTTEENLQARCRGMLLMSISNKTGALVLTTGNKSEVAVGYSTLYGDMAGGFDVLKDVPKTLVYRLANYRNQLAPCIPQRVIDRPPSAELAPGQEDQDSLPSYEILDQLLHLYVEQDLSADAIVAQGFSRDEVYRVLRLVDINEYKRRQAPIGVRISKRGFGRDRRYPITSGWRLGE